ncbi:response regulator receiver modulated diguanylate cyclase [Celeribacter indicus]|uniref:Response regulator receiver modulated diguanylate cyclase n=1 Tax=Celeribacter indicus TaxID=1208324 RepID=A0A0B5DZF0_9RHOB|nr:response regulator receiver modulated diguanylate cyclase [Celeribacter indicus]
MVDDDPNILRLMEGILSSLGHSDVVFAGSGEEALEIVVRSAYEFSTFFLDIEMPGLSGVDLCGAIRALPAHRHTPIIMLTAMTAKSYVDGAFLKGATDYLTKPIDVRELGARLRVAQMLYHEQRRAADARRKADTLRLEFSGGLPAPDSFQLADPIRIYDVPHVLDAVAMENYLYRMNRLKRFMFGAVGFKIRKVESLFALTTPVEFHGIVTDVAEAIFENLRGQDIMISYYGTGQFAALLPRNSSFDRDEFETALGLTLNEFGLTQEDGLPMDVSVAVGEHVQISMFDTNPQKLIAKALERVNSGRRPWHSASSILNV